MLSVGEILRQEREKKGIKLSDVSQHIKVREKFLAALEQNNWESFSSKIYITGIVKNYSQYLELDPKRTLAFFRRDYVRKEDMYFKRKVASSYLTSETKKVAVLVIFIISILFIGYFGYQLKLYFSPPKVVLVLPSTTEFKKEDKIRIVGKTEKDAAVTILGDRVYQNKDGIFEYDFPLKEEKNELIIEVTGANGRKSILKREFYKKSS